LAVTYRLYHRFDPLTPRPRGPQVSARALINEVKNTTGRIKVRLKWDPEPPPQLRVTVTVFEARGLKKMDLLGKNDTYVAMRCSVDQGQVDVVGVHGDSYADATDGETLHTATVLGDAPAWGEGGRGQALSFVVDRKDDAYPYTLSVRLFDEDEGSSDDLIGTVAITAADGKRCVDVLDAKGRRSGECVLQVTEAPVVSGAPTGRLSVTTIRGENLQKMDRLGKNDVYTVVTVADEGFDVVPSLQQATDDADEFSTNRTQSKSFVPISAENSNRKRFRNLDSARVQRSSTCKEGGSRPQWEDGGDRLTFSRPSMPKWVTVRCMDEDAGMFNNDDHIGTAIISLPASGQTPPDRAWQHIAWCDILAQIEKGEDESDSAAIQMEVKLSSELVDELQTGHVPLTKFELSADVGRVRRPSWVGVNGEDLRGEADSGQAFNVAGP
jgi:hypothetical protein